MLNKQTSNLVLDLAIAGAPIPEGVVRACLYVSGDAPLHSFAELVEAEDFVHALTQEGLTKQ